MPTACPVERTHSRYGWYRLAWAAADQDRGDLARLLLARLGEPPYPPRPPIALAPDADLDERWRALEAGLRREEAEDRARLAAEQVEVAAEGTAAAGPAP